MFGTCGQLNILSIAWKVADKKLVVVVVVFLQLQWGVFWAVTANGSGLTEGSAEDISVLVSTYCAA
jgi:hypothetical protein